MKVDESKLLKLGSSIAEETIANSSISDLSIGEIDEDFAFTALDRKDKLTKMDTELREPSQEIEACNKNFGKTSRD